VGSEQILRRSALFSRLSDGEIDKVALIITEREVAPGEMLIREGDEGDSLFILGEGRVGVLRNADHGQPARITELGEGAMFGEMSFIEHGSVRTAARSAGVVAQERAKVLELRFDALEQLAARDPLLGAKLYRALAVSINDKLKSTTDHLLPLIASARVAALGQMTAHIAHELGNPLSVLQSLSACISESINEGLAESGSLQEPRAGEIAQWADKVGATVAHIGRVISALRSVSRDGSADPLVPTDPGAIIHETLGFCEQRFRLFGIRVDTRIPSRSPSVLCRPSQVSQALLNLLNNSVDAIACIGSQGLVAGESWVSVSLEARGDRVVIAVEDSGPGVPAGSAETIFKPFYTTKGVGAGTGLGLSLSRQLIEANDGTLTLERASKPTRFEIQLPCARE
jgi:signal transduction histidine kinase